MTTDHTDLCKRLRHGFADENYSGQVDAVMEEAAKTIESLQADNAALREQVAELEKYAPPKSDRGGPRDPTAVWFDNAKKAEAERDQALDMLDDLRHEMLKPWHQLPLTEIALRNANVGVAVLRLERAEADNAAMRRLLLRWLQIINRAKREAATVAEWDKLRQETDAALAGKEKP